MPLADVAWVLEHAQGFCAKAGVTFSPYPMHESLSHPEAADLLRLFAAAPWPEDSAEPIATDGVALGIREDWRDLLDALRSLGTKTFWLAFHGIGEIHDRLVNRSGAYEASCNAVARARSRGFRCGCNVFVTKENIPQATALADALRQLGIEEMSWEVAHYLPTARLRQYEAMRPDVTDLLPLAKTIREYSGFHKDMWDNLEACTEAAYVNGALRDNSKKDDDSAQSSDRLQLVCRHNLDLHTGNAGTYGQFHGNLREPGADEVFQRAVDYDPCPEERLYFDVDVIPGLRDLAQQVGDPCGTKIHMFMTSMRDRWLDVALADHRRY
jgi:hypothetical protein